MKFVDFNPKEPKVSNRYGNILDDLGKLCELKVCQVGHGLVFTTKRFNNEDKRSYLNRRRF